MAAPNKYNPEDYKVTATNFNEDGTIRSFDVNILGADFIVYRVHNKFKPTKIFKFNRKIGYVVGDDNIVTNTVEIDWDTCRAGLSHLADQMELCLIPGINPVTTLGTATYFKET